MKISRVLRKKDMYLNREIFQVYMYKYAALIKLLVQLLIINRYVCSTQSSALYFIFASRLSSIAWNSDGHENGRSIWPKRAILRQSNTTPIFWERFIDDIIINQGHPTDCFGKISVWKAFNLF